MQTSLPHADVLIEPMAETPGGWIMEVRIGQVLVDNGVLSTKQVQVILSEQLRTGEPFGVLSERLFQVDPEAIEQAWATQYASLTRKVDPVTEVFDPLAMDMVTRRQAWQFRVLPIRFDDGELMLATTQQHLRRALRFATGVIGVPVFLVLCTPDELGEGLCHHYPLAGMTPRSVNDDFMDRVLGDRMRGTAA